MLAKAGIPEAALRCGPQWPYHKPSAQEARAHHDAPLRIWNNCSGKHVGMLAAAKAMGAPLESYLDPGHPVQREIVRHLAALAGVAVADVGVAVDGCSAPTFSVPFLPVVRSIRCFLRPETAAELEVAVAALARAWEAHPHLIAGPGRIDTVIMEASAARLLSKGGAEGVQVVGDLERDLVYVVKCADGNPRGSDVLMPALLERFGSLTSEEADAVRAGLSIGPLTNRDGEVVGHVEAVLPDAS
jgi:L-asparaginase II